MIKNVLMTIEYDGTGFSGWQIQPESRTVQGEVQKALKKICGQDIKAEGTSRTDAGVHALGQRASFKGDFGIPVERIARVMNSLLPGDIKIKEAKEMPLDFHARFDAKGKKYIYRIINCAEKNVFKRNFYYYYDRPLDVNRMRKAASYLVGTHDFASFMAMGSTPQETTVRTLYSYDVEERTDRGGEKEFELTVKGDGFLYNMVRIMTGTIIDAGRGAIEPEEVPEIICAGDRSRAGRTAPARGLYLAEVYYDKKYLEG